MKNFLNYYLLLKLKLKVSFLTKEEKFIVNQIVDSIWLNQNINLFRSDDDETGIHINQIKYYINKDRVIAGENNINVILNKKNITKVLFYFTQAMYKNYQQEQQVEEYKNEVLNNEYNQLLEKSETFFANLTYTQNNQNKDRILKLCFDMLKKEDDQLHDHLFKAILGSDKVEFVGTLNDHPGTAIRNNQNALFYLYLVEETNPPNYHKKYFIGYKLKDKSGEYTAHKSASYKQKIFFALLKKMVRINEFRYKESQVLKNQQKFLENCPEYHRQQIDQAINPPQPKII